jgi:hypothetical protein
MDRARYRGLFCLAVAVSAASLTDPLVEGASNAGWFGAANFTDHSTIDVVPALLTAAVLAVLYVVLRARPLAARHPDAVARLRASLRPCRSRPLVRLVPAIFAVQLGVLYCMETVEQVVVAGHAQGGLIWLGAPAAIALALHFAACLVATFVLARALDALTRAALDITSFVWTVLLERGCRQCTQVAWFELPPIVPKHPLASRAGKRAPPFLSA